jgi:hypothetical protein
VTFIVTDLGFSTADAESVQIRHEGGNLILSFVDWQQRPVQYVFEDVLSYHWGHDSGEVPQERSGVHHARFRLVDSRSDTLRSITLRLHSLSPLFQCYGHS